MITFDVLVSENALINMFMLYGKKKYIQEVKKKGGFNYLEIL